MIDRVIAGGVHAVFLLGSTGEGPALAMEERKRFLSVCVKAVAGRCPLLAGISGASFAEAKALGQFAAEAGVDAVVAAVPCFLPPEEEEDLLYYRLLAPGGPVAAVPLQHAVADQGGDETGNPSGVWRRFRMSWATRTVPATWKHSARRWNFSAAVRISRCSSVRRS